MAERFTYTRCPRDGKFVREKDYLALQAALREALDAWGNHAGVLSTIYAPELKRIAELRKFLDDK